MRLSARVRRLEAQGATTPTLVREWTDMLARLRASSASSAAQSPDNPAMHPPVYHVSDGEIETEARHLAGRGIPATFTDWFRHLEAVAAASGEHRECD